MTSLVQQLQRDALNQSVSVVELLQRSLVAATKLKQDEFLKWIHLELDGYGKTEVPSYRVVHGSPKVFNPYQGYQPLLFENPKTTENFSRMHFNTPIGEIEHSLVQGDKKKNAGTFAVSYHPEVEQDLMKAIAFNLQPSLHINASQFQNILDAVRKIILEWALKLEENGVVGDGLSFSTDDKAKAAQVVYNVKNYIQGTFQGSQLQIDTEHSAQTLKYKTLDPKEVGEFLTKLRDKASELNLVADSKAELESELKTIEAQVESPKPKDSILRESLGSVRRILESAAGRLVAGGLLVHLGRLFGT
jgi:AbiTii